MAKKNGKVGSFSWPFIRYDVLMPDQVRTDVFEWLYLALVVHENELRGTGRNRYEMEAGASARRTIKEKFSSLLDEMTIDKIIGAAEKDFVETTPTRYGPIKNLKEETFGFLNTYEELFGSEVSVRSVFQDALCGGVVPCFRENEYLQDVNRENVGRRLEAIVKDKPSKEQIREAYLLYNRLNAAADGQEDILDEDDEFYDPDAETGFEPYPIQETAGDFSEKTKEREYFSVHFIDNSRYIFNLEVPVYSDGERLSIGTPFDAEITRQWMNRRLIKARSVCGDLDEYLKGLEEKYTEPKEMAAEPAETSYIYRRGVADQLSVCGDIYRMVAHLPERYDDLKKLLIDTDRRFVSKDVGYFVCIGKYLECMLHYFIDRNVRKSRPIYDYDQFCRALNYNCALLGTDPSPLLKRNIYKDWDDTEKACFKADLADLFLSNARMRDNRFVYDEFVKDTVGLYNLRNSGSHYSSGGGRACRYDTADIEKLGKVTRVMIELM